MNYKTLREGYLDNTKNYKIKEGFVNPKVFPIKQYEGFIYEDCKVYPIKQYDDLQIQDVVLFDVNCAIPNNLTATDRTYKYKDKDYIIYIRSITNT